MPKSEASESARKCVTGVKNSVNGSDSHSELMALLQRTAVAASGLRDASISISTKHLEEVACSTSDTLSEKQCAHVKITEEPSDVGLNKVLEDSNCMASIRGINSTQSKITVPAIKVMECNCPAVVVVSCISGDGVPHHSPHPLELHHDGATQAADGVYVAQVDQDMTCVLSGLQLKLPPPAQRDKSLRVRSSVLGDPYKRRLDISQSLDVRSFRLCFQVYLEGPERGKFSVPLPPVLSRRLSLGGEELDKTCLDSLAKIPPEADRAGQPTSRSSLDSKNDAKSNVGGAGDRPSQEDQLSSNFAEQTTKESTSPMGNIRMFRKTIEKSAQCRESLPKFQCDHNDVAVKSELPNRLKDTEKRVNKSAHSSAIDFIPAGSNKDSVLEPQKGLTENSAHSSAENSVPGPTSVSVCDSVTSNNTHLNPAGSRPTSTKYPIHTTGPSANVNSFKNQNKRKVKFFVVSKSKPSVPTNAYQESSKKLADCSAKNSRPIFVVTVKKDGSLAKQNVSPSPACRGAEAGTDVQLSKSLDGKEDSKSLSSGQEEGTSHPNGKGESVNPCELKSPHSQNHAAEQVCNETVVEKAPPPAPQDQDDQKVLSEAMSNKSSRDSGTSASLLESVNMKNAGHSLRTYGRTSKSSGDVSKKELKDLPQVKTECISDFSSLVSLQEESELITSNINLNLIDVQNHTADNIDIKDEENSTLIACQIKTEDSTSDTEFEETKLIIQDENIFPQDSDQDFKLHLDLTEEDSEPISETYHCEKQVKEELVVTQSETIAKHDTEDKFKLQLTVNDDCKNSQALRSSDSSLKACEDYATMTEELVTRDSSDLLPGQTSQTEPVEPMHCGAESCSLTDGVRVNGQVIPLQTKGDKLERKDHAEDFLFQLKLILTSKKSVNSSSGNHSDNLDQQLPNPVEGGDGTLCGETILEKKDIEPSFDKGASGTLTNLNVQSISEDAELDNAEALLKSFDGSPSCVSSSKSPLQKNVNLESNPTQRCEGRPVDTKKLREVLMSPAGHESSVEVIRKETSKEVIFGEVSSTVDIPVPLESTKTVENFESEHESSIQESKAAYTMKNRTTYVTNEHSRITLPPKRVPPMDNETQRDDTGKNSSNAASSAGLHCSKMSPSEAKCVNLMKFEDSSAEIFPCYADAENIKQIEEEARLVLEGSSSHSKLGQEKCSPNGIERNEAQYQHKKYTKRDPNETNVENNHINGFGDDRLLQASPTDRNTKTTEEKKLNQDSDSLADIPQAETDVDRNGFTFRNGIRRNGSNMLIANGSSLKESNCNNETQSLSSVGIVAESEASIEVDNRSSDDGKVCGNSERPSNLTSLDVLHTAEGDLAEENYSKKDVSKKRSYTDMNNDSKSVPANQMHEQVEFEGVKKIKYDSVCSEEPSTDHVDKNNISPGKNNTKETSLISAKEGGTLEGSLGTYSSALRSDESCHVHEQNSICSELSDCSSICVIDESLDSDASLPCIGEFSSLTKKGSPTSENSPTRSHSKDVSVVVEKLDLSILGGLTTVDLSEKDLDLPSLKQSPQDDNPSSSKSCGRSSTHEVHRRKLFIPQKNESSTSGSPLTLLCRNTSAKISGVQHSGDDHSANSLRKQTESNHDSGNNDLESGNLPGSLRASPRSVEGSKAEQLPGPQTQSESPSSPQEEGTRKLNSAVAMSSPKSPIYLTEHSREKRLLSETDGHLEGGDFTKKRKMEAIREVNIDELLCQNWENILSVAMKTAKQNLTLRKTCDRPDMNLTILPKYPFASTRRGSYKCPKLWNNTYGFLARTCNTRYRMNEIFFVEKRNQSQDEKRSPQLPKNLTVRRRGRTKKMKKYQQKPSTSSISYEVWKKCVQEEYNLRGAKSTSPNLRNIPSTRKCKYRKLDESGDSHANGENHHNVADSIERVLLKVRKEMGNQSSKPPKRSDLRSSDVEKCEASKVKSPDMEPTQKFNNGVNNRKDLKHFGSCSKSDSLSDVELVDDEDSQNLLTQNEMDSISMALRDEGYLDTDSMSCGDSNDAGRCSTPTTEKKDRGHISTPTNSSQVGETHGVNEKSGSKNSLVDRKQVTPLKVSQDNGRLDKAGQLNSEGSTCAFKSSSAPDRKISSDELTKVTSPAQVSDSRQSSEFLSSPNDSPALDSEKFDTEPKSKISSFEDESSIQQNKTSSTHHSDHRVLRERKAPPRYLSLEIDEQSRDDSSSAVKESVEKQLSFNKSLEDRRCPVISDAMPPPPATISSRNYCGFGATSASGAVSEKGIRRPRKPSSISSNLNSSSKTSSFPTSISVSKALLEKIYGPCVGTKIRFKCGTVVPSYIFRNPEGVFIFHCTHCRYYTSSKQKIRVHDSSCNSLMACTRCNFKTYSSIEMKIHPRMHALDKHMCYCSECDYVTDNKGAIERHVMVHLYARDGTLDSFLDFYKTGGNTGLDIRCPFCEEFFKNMIEVRSHIRLHTDTRAFECSDCNFLCFSRAALSKHSYIHKREELHCPHCMFSTTDQNAIKEHFLTHVGAPY